MKVRHFTGYLLVALPLLLLSGVGRSDAEVLRFNEVVQGGVLLTTPSGQMLVRYQDEQLFVPASLLKIITVWAALEVLGPRYQFETRCYQDPAENLYIEGFGDPMLTSEAVRELLQGLRIAGVTTINHIYLDDQAYADLAPVGKQSDNPYDAPVGGLLVNFNTVAIRVLKGGQVVSDEVQTPTLPLMFPLGQGKAPGRYRLNVCQGQQGDCGYQRQYVGELVRGWQQRLAIPGQGEIKRAPVKKNAKLVYQYKNSQSLQAVVRACLKYSNNLVANQLFLTIGAQAFGYPATWEKGQRALHLFLEQRLGDHTSREINMVEGSGLSRENRLSARALVAVLRKFSPYAALLALKGSHQVKSGTLTGVYGYAGYLHGTLPFVIILNQPVNLRDTLLNRLGRMVPAN